MFEKLSQPMYKNGRFNNPWPTWKDVTVSNLVRYQFLSKDKSELPSKHVLRYLLPSHRVREDEINSFCYQQNSGHIKVIWIGHSTLLINMENKIILTDPVFGKRCSPSSSIGPKRLQQIPITIDLIPKIDFVILSHDHYDHLDFNAVRELNKKFAGKINWLVGVGTRELLISIGIIDNVFEFTWWQMRTFKRLYFVFTPAQHWSLRHLFDYNRCLWGSWTILSDAKRLFFAGDTGYCSAFKQIGKIYGPFDLALIPIGAYLPRKLLKEQHVNPREAVRVHLDIKAKQSVAIHWGTFILGREYFLGPREELEAALSECSLNEQSFLTLIHGETYEF